MCPSALGAPIDGAAPIQTNSRRRIRFKESGIIPRQSVHDPMTIGHKAVYRFIQSGRGTRELTIGGWQAGKAAIAVDAIINQNAINASPDTFTSAIAALRLKLCR